MSRMIRPGSLMTAAVFVATVFASAPALAQGHHNRDDDHGRRPSGQSRFENQQGSQGRAVARGEARNAERPVMVAPRAERPVAVAPRAGAPTVVAPRVVGPRVVAPVAPTLVAPRAVAPHPYYSRPYYAPVRPYYAHPYYAHPYYAHPYYAHPYYAAPYYPRPYVFHPHLHLSFGVVVGYPVPYAYAYPYPVPVYGYAAPPAPVVVGPNSTMYGGVSLEFSPSTASVYVDGGYAGAVRDFDGIEHTLTLAGGRHRVEITAPGYEPITLTVDAVPGQIVPYQGSLQPF